MNKRDLLHCFAVFAGSIALLGVSTGAFSQSPEEISGRVLKQQIQEKAVPYIKRLEEKKGRELTSKEREDIVWRLWTASKQSLEFNNAYAVIDP